jgi:hypothetical protein
MNWPPTSGTSGNSSGRLSTVLVAKRTDYAADSVRPAIRVSTKGPPRTEREPNRPRLRPTWRRRST